MKVILLQDVKGSGKKDQIIEVSEGFGRNYLLPRKLAKEATSEAVNSIEKSQLYGTVTNDALAKALKEQYGIDVDKRKFEPESPIKTAGQTMCVVRLSAGVATRMIVNVTVEEK